MVLINLIFISLISNAAGQKSCEEQLQSFSEQQVLSDAGDLLLNVEMPPIISDTINPLMGLFEPLNGMSSKYKHELRTARDLATYLHDKHGQRFVLVGHIEGRDVPVFDGLVFDADGTPAYNVSLKFAALTAPSMNREKFLKRYRERIRLRSERQRTKSLIHWLKVVGGWSRDASGDFCTKDYQQSLKLGVLTAHIFGLTNPNSFPCGRELRTVVDMRESGYTFDFVNQPDFLEEIGHMVQRNGSGAFTLTLLWDQSRVLEFGP